MWELEMSCRYNLRSIFAVKMLILGCVDFFVLGAAIFITGLSGTKFALTAVMILVPFNLSNSLYLWLIVKLRHRCTNYVLAGTGVFLSLIMLWINGALNQTLFAKVFSQYMVAVPILTASWYWSLLPQPSYCEAAERGITNGIIFESYIKSL